MKKETQRARIVGNNIYLDKNRTIYYDPISKKAHQITKGDEKVYLLFQAMIPVAILVAALIAYFTGKNILALIVGLVIIVASHVIFRVSFIANLPEYPHFTVPEKNSFIDGLAKNNQTYKLATNAAVMAVLAVLVFVNAYSQKYDQLTTVLNYAVTVLFAALSVINVIALVRKRKN